METQMNFRNFANKPLESANANQPGVFSLARQSSVYSLTFDEFQRGVSLGKDFGSMNMDELLKNIWTVEESQQILGCTSAFFPVGTEESSNPSNYLHRQRSLSITLPQILGQKTVEEVWNDSNKVMNLPPRKLNLGEVTLEEFLVRAGIVKVPEKPENFEYLGDLNRPVCNESSGFGFQQIGNQVLENDAQHGLMGNCAFESNNQSNLQTNNLTLHLNEATNQQPQQIFPKQTTLAYADPIHVSNDTRIGGQGIGIMNNMVQNGGMGITVVATNGMAISTSSPNLDTPSVKPVPYVFTETLRGRRGNNVVEKVIERRHRRMIKNRESAARSRARKQAYIMELEAEIANLKEEHNALQKRQTRIMEMQKNKISVKKNMQQEGKRRLLQRTNTGPW